MLKFAKALFAGVMGAAPCWVLAVLFIRTWQTPMAVDEGRWVKLGVGIMVLELVLVHSGALFTAFAQRRIRPDKLVRLHQRIGAIFGALCLYIMFAACFSLAFNTWTLFWIFCWVTASRLLGMLFDAEDGSRMMARRSGVSALLYLLSAFISVFVALPRGGLTTEVLDKVYPERGSGLWETDPQQALLAGMVYFGCLGLWELLVPFWAARKKRRDQALMEAV